MVIKVWMDDDAAHETIEEITEVIERYQEGPYDAFGWEEIAAILEDSGVKLKLSPTSRRRMASSYPLNLEQLVPKIGFEDDAAYKKEFRGD